MFIAPNTEYQYLLTVACLLSDAADRPNEVTPPLIHFGRQGVRHFSVQALPQWERESGRRGGENEKRKIK